ncbi:hypothetical protein HYT25_01015 [Candidatus Pacearchaeota archaeon]|nr:hypothetical protein [Candidatus Pacearchaeota archaeon]
MKARVFDIHGKMADEKSELELLGKRLVKVVRESALDGLNIPLKHFPNCGFDKLPEYKIAMDVIEKYAEAVGTLYHKNLMEDL